jgi:hypothetical protein
MANQGRRQADSHSRHDLTKWCQSTAVVGLLLVMAAEAKGAGIPELRNFEDHPSASPSTARIGGQASQPLPPDVSAMRWSVGRGKTCPRCTRITCANHQR